MKEEDASTEERETIGVFSDILLAGYD